MKYAAAYLLVRRAYVQLRRIDLSMAGVGSSRSSRAPRAHVWRWRVADVHQREDDSSITPVDRPNAADSLDVFHDGRA